MWKTKNLCLEGKLLRCIPAVILLFSYISYAESTSVLQRYTRAAAEEDDDPGTCTASLCDADSLLDKLIPKDYSIHVPPPTPKGSPLEVNFSFIIINLPKINELDGEVTVELNLRAYWKEPRLNISAFNWKEVGKFLTLNPVVIPKLWTPDMYIDHVRKAIIPTILSQPASFRVYPNSEVRYSARRMLIFGCRMNFQMYPSDEQRCPMVLKSYGYTVSEMMYFWKDFKQLNFHLSNWDLRAEQENFVTNSSSSGLRYPGVRYRLLLRRKLSYHIIQTYIPSGLFIVVSWLSFLVPPESVPGRMAICMTTLLTLTAMFAAVRQSTPTVSYVKALDIWMVVCIVFVFLTLLEYTIVLKLKSLIPAPKPHEQPPDKVTPSRGPSPTPSKQQVNYQPVQLIMARKNSLTGTHHEISMTPTLTEKRPRITYSEAVEYLEKISRLAIPLAFVIFNFIYWPWLLYSPTTQV